MMQKIILPCLELWLQRGKQEPIIHQCRNSKDWCAGRALTFISLCNDSLIACQFGSNVVAMPRLKMSASFPSIAEMPEIRHQQNQAFIMFCKLTGTLNTYYAHTFISANTLIPTLPMPYWCKNLGQTASCKARYQRTRNKWQDCD